MSILIKGMEMPKNCVSCRLRHSNDCLAILRNGQEEDGVLEYRNYRPSWCPLVEIPSYEIPSYTGLTLDDYDALTNYDIGNEVLK